MSTSIKKEIVVFDSFVDYWYFAKNLTKTQRRIIFTSLPSEQRDRIEKSYERGGWHDLVMRNELNQYTDMIYEQTGFDLMNIRAKVFLDKSVFVPRKFWDSVVSYLEEYKPEDIRYIIGDIRSSVCRANEEVVLLTRD